MRFSAEKQSYLSHQIANRLLSKNLISASSKEVLFELVKNGVREFVDEWEGLNQEITHKIESIKRGISPGSSEWDILYAQFLAESFRKKSRLFVKK